MMISESTWIEIRDAIASGAAGIIPLGSTEEHGPCVPTGDYLVVDEIARRTAVATGDLVAPTLPFGYSEYFRHYPGTFTLRAETLTAVIEDVVSSFAEHGVTRIAVFNGHTGNAPVIQLLSRRLKRTTGLIIFTLSPFEVMRVKAQDVYERDVTLSHGGEPMESLALALVPHLVKGECRDSSSGPRPAESVYGYPRVGLNSIVFDGIRVDLPIDAMDVADSAGRLGPVEEASAAIGEALLEQTVQYCAAFMRWLRELPDPPS
jgi:creatinine amidohydrolase